MVGESQIHVKLIAALTGRLSIPDFGQWVLAQSWNMHRDSTQGAQDLMSAVQLALFEYTDGVTSADELRDELRKLARTVSISVDLRPPGAGPKVSGRANELLVRLPAAVSLGSA